MPERVGAACHRRKQTRPRELLDAALALFVERGFAAARAEDIAARAGVSKATLYLYFGSKEDLLMALLAERFASGIAIGAQEPSDARASPELLREVLTRWRSALMKSQAGGIFKLVLTEVRSFPSLAAFWSREVMEPARRCVTRIVVRGIERGEFRPVDPDLVVHALVLPVLFMCLHRHAIGPCVPDDALMNAPDLFTRHLEFVLEGLAQPQGDPHVRND
ncbi:TetR/AcrR family transcriptional regulator [Rhizobacter sp. SG703]|uniref:TetR/AcrR family transcriptional regulator n=1 Tax=Rhizobacter sp. SG703 TaxID=2587140 RepID=UPI0014469781|nr:TetR/AcrR family transcriptional regulator [Rhizobacter sp. SG703]NKI93716.1 AcrR family transcriptional regulator [Rhizobacter sp. SG703]